MPLKIQALHAWEILDSRGRPTLSVEALLSDGATAVAQAPSGASTGTHEAVELRDGDPARYGGRGVLVAVSNVNGEIARAVAGRNAEDQAGLDGALIALDGTAQKSRLGANALLGVSCAVARAVSVSRGQPLFETLSLGNPTLPVPMINILSGGLHAGANIEFQDFLIIPHGFDSYAEALEATVKIHGVAGDLIRRAGYLLTGVADEGGWGPLLPSNQAALELLNNAIGEAGFQPGEQVSMAIDVASSHFYRAGRYTLKSEGRELGSEVKIFADVLVKHARPLGTPNLTTAVQETIERGLADGVILSGWATGSPPSLEDLELATRAAKGTPVLIGSGADWENIYSLMPAADGVIVSSSLKRQGQIEQPIDPIRVSRFVEATRRSVTLKLEQQEITLKSQGLGARN